MKRTKLFVLILFVGFFTTNSRSQNTQTYALNGTLVTPDRVIPNGEILVSGEKISAVGNRVNSPPDSKKIETDSFIFPGLIDLHNHITWNIFPRWKPNILFANRYEWQQLPAYSSAINAPHFELVSEGLNCEMYKYGELKAIVGGATSVTGSFPFSDREDRKCIDGLARTLDFHSGLYKAGESERLRYEVFPFQLSLKESQDILGGLKNGTITSYIIHIAEGKPTDASAAREFAILGAQGFLTKGVVIIHGVALGESQFQEMARNGVGLIWSPRSNIELYGATADVATAKRDCIMMALAPDWSPTGSSGMLEELKYATMWNARQGSSIFSEEDLVKMATVYPAQLAGLDDKIGKLARGLYADLLLLKRKGSDPYQALISATPSDIRLVVVGGTPVYGDPDLMNKLLPGRHLDSLNVCGEEKALYLDSQSLSTGLSSKSWSDTSKKLSAALQEWNTDLAPLASCN